MRHALAALSAAVVLATAPYGAARAQDAIPVAIFDFELIDTSLEGELAGPRADETARLAMLGDMLREAYGADPRYDVVDIGPVHDAARERNLQSCGGCDRGLARTLGADVSITGTVQKVSNLILNINVYLRDTGEEGEARAFSADIRGNDDRSWRRGLQWLMRNRLGLDAG